MENFKVGEAVEIKPNRRHLQRTGVVTSSLLTKGPNSSLLYAVTLDDQSVIYCGAARLRKKAIPGIPGLN